jgi:steroid delta-isomerase-like uncharacterized protein
MTSNLNKEAARTYFAKVLNQGDMDSADRIFAPGLLFHYPLGQLNGADAVKTYLQTFRIAFPDAIFEVSSLIGEGRHVSARWSLSGSQTGDFKGKPPTGKRVSLPGITWFEVDDGRIQEMWIAFDPTPLVG